jgi:anti-sigma factor RsiW
VVKQFGKTECARVQSTFSGYLDGAISGREMQLASSHLERCGTCAGEFESWRGMQRLLTEHGVTKAPADLGLKLRLAISHETTRRQSVQDNLAMRWENLVRPMLVQAASGIVGAMLLVGGISMLVGVVSVPNAVLANDEPLGAVTMPHYLYSAAQEQPVLTRDDSTIVVQADVNAEGRVYDYSIVSGPTDEKTTDEVRNQLMLQVYEPARMFGEPVRGQVLVTFSGVLVKG